MTDILLWILGKAFGLLLLIGLISLVVSAIKFTFSSSSKGNTPSWVVWWSALLGGRRN